jgi:hypothetical protein
MRGVADHRLNPDALRGAIGTSLASIYTGCQGAVDHGPQRHDKELEMEGVL